MLIHSGGGGSPSPPLPAAVGWRRWRAVANGGGRASPRGTWRGLVGEGRRAVRARTQSPGASDRGLAASGRGAASPPCAPAPAVSGGLALGGGVGGGGGCVRLGGRATERTPPAGGVDGSHAGGRAGWQTVGGAWRSSVFWRRRAGPCPQRWPPPWLQSMAAVGQLVRGLATGCTDLSGDGIWPGGGRGGGVGWERRRARRRGMTPPHITPAWATPHYSATTCRPWRQREKMVMIGPCAGSPPCLLSVFKGASTSGHGILHTSAPNARPTAPPPLWLFSRLLAAANPACFQRDTLKNRGARGARHKT